MEDEAGTDDLVEAFKARRQRNSGAPEAPVAHAPPRPEALAEDSDFASPPVPAVPKPAPVDGRASTPEATGDEAAHNEPVDMEAISTPGRTLAESERAAETGPAQGPEAELDVAGIESLPIVPTPPPAMDASNPTTRGSAIGQTVALFIMALALAVLAYERRAIRFATPHAVSGIALTWVALAVVAFGLILLLLFMFVPGRRTLQVRQGRPALAIWAGGLFGVMGLAMAVLFAARAPLATLNLGLAFAGAVTVTGMLVYAWGRGRNRVAPALAAGPSRAVLLRLDELLGKLPEEDVRAFVASPEGEAYLKLLDEMNHD